MTSQRKYRIASSNDYFLAGCNADLGIQVLMGTQGSEIVCLFFNLEGHLLRYETKQASTQELAARQNEHEQWLNLLGVSPDGICIEKFSVPERWIEILDLPGYLQEFKDDPTSVDEDRRSHLSEYIANWEYNGDFVMIWDEEYEMNAQGEVTST